MNGGNPYVQAPLAPLSLPLALRLLPRRSRSSCDISLGARSLVAAEAVLARRSRLLPVCEVLLALLPRRSRCRSISSAASITAAEASSFSTKESPSHARSSTRVFISSLSRKISNVSEDSVCSSVGTKDDADDTDDQELARLCPPPLVAPAVLTLLAASLPLTPCRSRDAGLSPYPKCASRFCCSYLRVGR